MMKMREEHKSRYMWNKYRNFIIIQFSIGNEPNKRIVKLPISLLVFTELLDSLDDLVLVLGWFVKKVPVRFGKKSVELDVFAIISQSINAMMLLRISEPIEYVNVQTRDVLVKISII